MEPAKSVEQVHQERQELYRKLWAENQWLYGVWGVVIGLLLAAVIGGNISAWDTIVSFAPEFAGLLFVTLILDRRAAYRERERRKQQLISNLRGGSTEFALQAVNELSHEGWLTDGTLQNASLFRANLQNADLSEANLKGALVWDANLQGADLNEANLQNAGLIRANLQGARLVFANLQNAVLRGANLQGAHPMLANLQNADLFRADLKGAQLWDANLQGATFSASKFDKKTMLPDASYYDPQQGPEQLERFTNPKHPVFWRSENPHSPAFRGDPESAGDEVPGAAPHTLPARSGQA